ncbi:nicotinamide mononucleotide transporter [bacterium]|nr:nicotinamide mononucleotide transporter [bacterium]
MNLTKLLKQEFSNFTKRELIVFSFVILTVLLISLSINDNKIALISAICGISYTILAGKGKVSCYYIGIIGTLCYSYLSFVNGFFGQLALYALYYLPMELIGIYKWKQHLNKEKNEIIKTRLSLKERILYLIIGVVITFIGSFILKYAGDKKPILDSFTVVFSVFGQILTVKRCIEQWYVWFFVNIVTLVMWCYAYINGSNCFATILMWFIYSILAVYFLCLWKKEVK